jgi:hypothetical protein
MDAGAPTGLWRILRRRGGRPVIDFETARRRPRLLVDPGPEMTGYLWRHRRALLAWLNAADGEVSPSAVAEDLSRLLVRWLQGRNQFLEAKPKLLDAVRGAYARCVVETGDLLAEVRDEAALQAGLRDLLERHHDRLGDLLSEAYGARLKEAVWSQYSAALQARVLRLEGRLADPVLDVGCGADGALTLALRTAGHEVVGFDRDPARADLLRADWLDFDYGRGRWGSVLSHLGFSLHFLHHHLAGAEQAFAYARTYRRILESLRRDGVFAYAPALPFVEELLPAGFTVDRFQWGEALQSSTLVTRRGVTS